MMGLRPSLSRFSSSMFWLIPSSPRRSITRFSSSFFCKLPVERLLKRPWKCIASAGFVVDLKLDQCRWYGGGYSSSNDERYQPVGRCRWVRSDASVAAAEEFVLEATDCCGCRWGWSAPSVPVSRCRGWASGTRHLDSWAAGTTSPKWSSSIPPPSEPISYPYISSPSWVGLRRN